MGARREEILFLPGLCPDKRDYIEIVGTAPRGLTSSDYLSHNGISIVVGSVPRGGGEIGRGSGVVGVMERWDEVMTSSRLRYNVPQVRASGTGWPRCIECLKLHISFRKRATNYRALVQKMTYKDKAACGSWPPCNDTVLG